MSEPGKKQGRPRKEVKLEPWDRRTPIKEPTAAEIFDPLSATRLQFLDLAGFRKRLTHFHALKSDPLGDEPNLPGEFASVISGFPESAFTNEAAVLLTFGKTTDPAVAEALLPLAHSIEAGRQQSRETVGAYMACAVEHFTADQAEDFFNRIVKMMREHEKAPHRNAWAYSAYSDFVDQVGKEPSKAKLRKFMIERPDKYRDQPPAEDKKGWTRLWAASGLFKLRDR